MLKFRPVLFNIHLRHYVTPPPAEDIK